MAKALKSYFNQLVDCQRTSKGFKHHLLSGGHWFGHTEDTDVTHAHIGAFKHALDTIHKEFAGDTVMKPNDVAAIHNYLTDISLLVASRGSFPVNQIFGSVRIS